MERTKDTIIFLDIDGVLVSYLNLKERHHLDNDNVFVKYSVDTLLEMIKYFDADVVLSSSWRVGNTVNSINDIFELRGLTRCIIDFTPKSSNLRGKEIEDWLYENDFTGKYIIIDDEISDIKDYHEKILQPNRYRCLDKFDFITLKRNNLINIR